jgi:hypothetical protein
MPFHHQATAAPPAERPAERHGQVTACLRSLCWPAPTSSPVHRFPGLLLLLVALVSWTSLLGSATAASVVAHGHRQYRATSAHLSDPLQDTLVPVSKGASLVIDTTAPPPFMPPAYHGDTTKTTTAPSKRALQTDPSASGNFQIPTPFDSALSNNFTSNCATFFKTMLASETVTGCHPFSLMLRVRAPLTDSAPGHDRD